jgi:hypothetical protein
LRNLRESASENVLCLLRIRDVKEFSGYLALPQGHYGTKILWQDVVNSQKNLVAVHARRIAAVGRLAPCLRGVMCIITSLNLLTFRVTLSLVADPKSLILD